MMKIIRHAKNKRFLCMNKKGLALGTIIISAVLLVFLGVFIWGLLCPKCVVSTAVAAADKTSDMVLGGLKEEEFKKEALQVDKLVEDAYNNILSVLSKEGNGPCIFNHAAFPDDFKGFAIKLSTDGTNTFVQLPNNKGQPVYSRLIEGKVPCAVMGTAAENFYDNYLDGSKCAGQDCKTDYAVAAITFNDKGHINFGATKNDLKDRNLVFKAKDGNVCFLPTGNNGNGCSRGGKIDEDCLGKIQDNIIACGEGDKYPFVQDLIDKGYTKEFRDAAIKFSDAIKQAVNSNEDVCRAEFSRYPGFGDKGIVSMFKDGNNLRVDVSPNLALVQPSDIILLQRVDNYQPCIVNGQNFWEWLWNTEQKENQPIFKTYVKIVGADKMKVFPKSQTENAEAQHDLFGGRPLIYKAPKAGTSQKGICLIPAFEDSNNNCGKDGDANRNYVDADCLRGTNLDAGNRIPAC